MAKEHYEVTSVFPTDWIVNGKTLTEPVEMSAEELRKSEVYPPENSSVYDIFKKINEERWEETRKDGNKANDQQGSCYD
ncbi:TPA: hypothetical protein U1X41_001551 [Streptococcus suis]|nr:hypothetical protein [Streptococcus suis]HEL1697023.1 hypothetical protein [Streptococcus suis]HEM2777347.1 hypothetical protein [Streptococcus suis]HEM2827514.1 hypothetical protein [Streptococcus suis]HEM4256063.1 hypothetical protein [Streptococcus suis]